MSVYLKQFSTHSEYEQYINGSGAILPNVSFCVQENEINYKSSTTPPTPPAPKLVCVYNVSEEEVDSDIKLMNKIEYGLDNFEKMEVDGVELDGIVDTYRFQTEGSHTVEYVLKNSDIGTYLFTQCYSLTSIIIPDSVTSIGDYAFGECNDLVSIRCNATTAPTTYFAFGPYEQHGTLYVPIGSTGYDAWLEEYGELGPTWTKVEQ